jgi:N-formylglutamate deformylase
MPAVFAGDLAVAKDFLWCDWLTRELYEFLPGLGITTITTRFSRFVADVNRDPLGEQHGGFWTSVVAARMPNGRAVYTRPLTAEEIAHRIRAAHQPFHRALDTAVARLLGKFPRLLVLDLHSFGVALEGDVILGDRHGLTARPAATGVLARALAGQGLSVRANQRFTGGFTVRKFAGCERVDAVQLELSQRRYLDLDGRVFPRPPRPLGFGETQRLLATALSDVVAGLDEWLCGPVAS